MDKIEMLEAHLKGLETGYKSTLPFLSGFSKDDVIVRLKFIDELLTLIKSYDNENSDRQDK